MSQAKSQLIALARLQRRVSEGSAASLAEMRGEVTAMVAATQAVATSGTPQDVKAMQAAQVALRQASVVARAGVQDFVHDFYDNRMFDRWLTFASTEDEEEYRRRERERREAIEKALAEHTPRGDLKALDTAIDQMKDAGAHGATKSPEFQKRLDALQARRDGLANAIAHSEPAKNVGAPDELAAVKPDAAVSPDLIAGLRAAGVTIPDQSGGGHGVGAGKPAVTGRSPT